MFKMNNKTGKNTEKKEIVTIDLKSVDAKVVNVRVLNERTASFTLRCKGFSFYNLKCVEYGNVGHEHYFIAMSQHKGKNEEYYDDYKVYFSKEDENMLIKEVLKQIEE